MFKEFKEFAMRGNAVDMAIGITVGAGFGKVVTSFVNDVLMPPLGLVLGRLDFTNLFVSLNRTHYASLAEAKTAGAPTLNYGLFINNIIDFLIIAFVIFLLVRQINRTRNKPEPAVLVPNEKECPYCLSKISFKASRCPQCTSDLKL